MSLKEYLSNLKKMDWLLFTPVLLLIIFGLATLYTTNLNVENPDWTAFNKQLLSAGLGLIGLFVIKFIDYRRLTNYSWLIYIVALILLAVVFLWGKTIRGTTGWFVLFGFNFQPVELAKFALVLTVASLYHKHRGREKSFSTVATLILITTAPVILTMLQPDLGSAAMLLTVGLAFFGLLSLKPKQIIYVTFMAIVTAIAVWNFVLVDYQKNRIMTFVDPMRDPLGRGYNVRQSMIAVGAGQALGRGLGLGTQSQLRFLPETATDFIFAAIAESLGLLGASVLLALIAWLFLRILMIIKKCRDNLSAYLVFGFGVIFFTQTVINIGMNLGLLPVMGLPLPFVSYGGSFLILSLAAIGVMESVSIRQRGV
ncbi:rod shape-determining protein RodA [Candidatus Kuenenbacteria bacterium RIFCSPLOWO2_12_FULL_42_13]|uniref:Rod shape-determining protein RodA n=4 Tax=Candidatus Kueneniibacteriota TaxID=1752740 RepID=A0A0G0YXK6_9BACT|nr:MAG: Rod shape-determining protein RodA [Candidatus Kuenenbacteria bacterium GW2011_GWA2_42_15]OGG89672.1 MAG: rod shape-determining protein RodA [Candidatus Kuenenbacteria bacterium RIFCSPHIGHO2_02_FULL_42_29]OGG92524.1 MAG: rod shape-determining protein RodA [Candidatus Kuenenbacteria bacterium RIFCSPLOWO2_12_FULL_42_13]OGG95914.1 MAG: rod shape-determining protein RodA [Candidatus Kuenenbacteria bacterium RBG_16_41_7]OGG99353.1 MAG: rod shape-determining protein RodA [Candidatus Kuenenbac